MRPTIRDVAQRLNLSITTVSRAMDGYSDVAEETRKLVIETAQTMGYTPNRAARQLRRQRADTLGYILPFTGTGFSDPFFSEFIAGLGDEAAAHNYDLLVSTAAPASAEERALYQRWAQSGKIDGMVLNRVYLDDWRLKYLSTQGIPHVSLERSPSQDNFVGIEVDARHEIAALISHLANLGHSRIAYIGGDTRLKIDYDRCNDYAAGLKEASITPDPALKIHMDLTPEGGYRAAEHLLNLERSPSAIICVNDLVAMGAMHAAHVHGLKVGRDIAIAGFDGIADSAHTQPPLTTLDQPVYAIARRLVIMLLALINNEKLEESQVKIHPKLTLRESTGG